MNTGFVYKWTNDINGKWYIGSRKGTPKDGYRHSSEILAKAEEKYGIENFTREILFEGDYDNDCIREIEAEYLQSTDAATNPMSYNRTNISGPNCFSEETKKGIAQRMIGNDHAKGSTSIWKGKSRGPQSEEHKKKRSIAMLGKNTNKTPWHKGKKVGPYGPMEKTTCPHCDRVGGKNAMKRYHFNNCKNNNEENSIRNSRRSKL